MSNSVIGISIMHDAANSMKDVGTIMDAVTQGWDALIIMQDGGNYSLTARLVNIDKCWNVHNKIHAKLLILSMIKWQL